MTLLDVQAVIAARGLAYRGGFRLQDEDLCYGLRAQSLVLVGFTGESDWAAFSTSLECVDGEPHPLDRWSRRVVGSIARELDATPIFPFDGPPWWPFSSWARKAEPLFPSPLGMLIHPKWGLWHSWRGALAFGESLEFPSSSLPTGPCTGCSKKPCLTACPVRAFTGGTYDVPACVGHLASPEGFDCMGFGCAARRACPVGKNYQYGTEQVRFHMQAFQSVEHRSRI